jgi:BirA family biotin operon repressor/biotin-[acetyl-CoA-carboxylase] ligase
MAQKQDLDNFTTVVADEQISGKGQHENSWFASPKKNLTLSVFIRFPKLFITNKTYLNFAVSLAIFDCLESLNTPNISIKWPNDILSGKQKVCGILIEPNLQGEFVKSAIIGIGLNVNEDVFPVELPKATSLKIIHKKVFNLEIVMQKLLDKLDEKIGLLNKNKFSLLEEEYLKHLYKKDIVATFSTKENTIFSGIIKGVSKTNGKLQVLLENENIEEFGIQEIKFL